MGFTDFSTKKSQKFIFKNDLLLEVLIFGCTSSKMMYSLF